MKRKKQEQPECTGLCSMCGKDHWRCMCLSDVFNLVLKQMRNPKPMMTTKNGTELEVGQVWTDPSDGHKRKWELIRIIPENDMLVFDGSLPLSSIRVGQSIRPSSMVGWKLLPITTKPPVKSGLV